MDNGWVYFITDASHASGKDYGTRAYFIRDLSTTITADQEDDSAYLPPKIDPADHTVVQEFIRNEFLDEFGRIKERFIPLCVGETERENPEKFNCRLEPVDEPGLE